MSVAASEPAPATRSTILTWRAPDVARMESVRIQLSGKRIKANGQIVAAATATYPAFSAYYDLQTDAAGATRRIGLTVTLAERERQLSIARDEENMWLVTDYRGESRAGYDGALDVEVVFSPFFSTLPIRRIDLTERTGTVTVPTIYVRLPEMSVTAASTTYTSYSGEVPGQPAGISVRPALAGTGTADTIVSVDADGFIVNYPGLAERI